MSSLFDNIQKLRSDSAVVLDRALRLLLRTRGIEIPAKYTDLLTDTHIQEILVDQEAPLHPSIPALAKGETQVWYARSSRDLGMGYEFCKKHGLLPDLADLTKTHVLLGKVASTDHHELYYYLQGENWGRGDLSNALLASKGLHHTSFSTGDILVIRGRVLMADRYGSLADLRTGEKV